MTGVGILFRNVACRPYFRQRDKTIRKSDKKTTHIIKYVCHSILLSTMFTVHYNMNELYTSANVLRSEIEDQTPKINSIAINGGFFSACDHLKAIHKEKAIPTN